MPRRVPEALNLDKVHAQFEDWRRNRKGRAAIPDELWLSAIQVARRLALERSEGGLGFR